MKLPETYIYFPIQKVIITTKEIVLQHITYCIGGNLPLFDH